jgi:hypothetical protein
MYQILLFNMVKKKKKLLYISFLSRRHRGTPVSSLYTFLVINRKIHDEKRGKNHIPSGDEWGRAVSHPFGEVFCLGVGA